MMVERESPRLGRCVALAAAAVSAFVVLAGAVHAVPAPGFDGALTWLAGWVLLGCCGWAVVVALALVAAGLRGPDLLRRCCPRAWRPAVLAAAGAAVAAGSVVPAQAQGWQPPSLARPVDGPAAPDRPAGAVSQAAPAVPIVVVRRGDSLWRIVARRWPDADDPAVAALVATTYRANRAAIGPDPDLLRPGLRLRLPDERTHR